MNKNNRVITFIESMKLKFFFLFIGISLTSLLFGQNDSLLTLTGIITQGTEPAVGTTVYIKGSITSATAQINGDFTLTRSSNEDIVLVVNPCCTCICPSSIPVEKNVSRIIINCICKNRTKKSKIKVVKYINEGGKTVQRKEVFRVCM